MTDKPRKSGRLQLLLVALVFIGPLLVAAWLYFQGGSFAPAGRSNHGVLLEPIVNVGDELPGSPVIELYDGNWLLVYMNAGVCAADCRETLYAQRQSRLMLGKEMDRLRRVFLHGDTPPDTVFLAAEHEGLVAIEDESLYRLLENKKPGDFAGGGFYLIDPLGNLVMYFGPGIDPYDMVDDIKHLLRLSRIG